MKTMFCLMSAALILLTSCGNKFSLQKRRYAKGYYFAGVHSKKRPLSSERNTASESNKSQVSDVARIEDRFQNKSHPAIEKSKSPDKTKTEINSQSANKGDSEQKHMAGAQRLNLPSLKDKLTSFSGFMGDGHKHEKKFRPVQKLKHARKNILMDFIVGYYVIWIVIIVIALIYFLVTGGITLASINWGLVLLYILLIGICILVGRAVRG